MRKRRRRSWRSCGRSARRSPPSNPTRRRCSSCCRMPPSAPPAERAWPVEGDSRVPYWIYTDEAVYRRELERIFQGPTWNYVGLECEIPDEGDYKRSFIGEQSVLIVRGK